MSPVSRGGAVCTRVHVRSVIMLVGGMLAMPGGM